MAKVNDTNNKQPKPRMDPDHLFKFNCRPGVACFTQCCQDVTIVLTPFDLLRLRKGLGISSDQFLEKYTIVIPKERRLIPLVVLKMNEEDKRCPLVSEEGCIAYDDRPWPCRMYPLDMDEAGTFHLVSDASRCRGLDEKDEWRIGDWLVDQGIVPYDEMNELFSNITTPLRAQESDIDSPQIAKMIFMAFYDLDKFREFVFKSTFLDRFDVDPVTVEKIKRNDVDLLRFAFDWIKFGLFGQKLFWVKQDPQDANQK